MKKHTAAALAQALLAALLSGCRPFATPPTDTLPRPEFSGSPMLEETQSKGADTYETK